MLCGVPDSYTCAQAHFSELFGNEWDRVYQAAYRRRRFVQCDLFARQCGGLDRVGDMSVDEDKTAFIVYDRDGKAWPQPTCLFFPDMASNDTFNQNWAVPAPGEPT